MYYEVVTGTETAIKDKINGALTLAQMPATGLPLGGKTLIFTTPSATVTLPGAADALVTPAQLVTAIQAPIPTMLADIRPDGTYYRVTLYRGAGFVIATTGTANADLGLSTSVATESLGSYASDAVILLQRIGPQDQFLLISQAGDI